MILASGTTMLAAKTISARYHEPEYQRYSTPLRIVSSEEPKRELVYMMGSVFAGTQRALAAPRYAQQGAIERGLREASRGWQRGQAAPGAAGARDTRPQVPHEKSPRSAAALTRTRRAPTARADRSSPRSPP